MTKRLDRKLAKIRAGAYAPTDFIIADAKDGDMAFGCTVAGTGADGRMKPLRAYRDDMVKVTESDLADIMLMSVSSAEVLTREGVFADTPVTPAVRFNDTTDIWHPRGAVYAQSPALPFRTAVLERVKPVADLGLYAVTFYNDLERDIHTLENTRGFVRKRRRRGCVTFSKSSTPPCQSKPPPTILPPIITT